MGKILHFLIWFLLVNSVSAQYLSKSGLTNRSAGQYVFSVKSATDGTNRTNSFNDKWIIMMFDYAGGANGYFNNYAKKTSLLKGGVAHQNAIGTTYFDGPWEWGYSFYHLPSGNGTTLPSTFNNGISTKTGAYNNIGDWFKNVLNNRWSNKNWLSSVSGFYYFHHHGLEWASENGSIIDMVGSEVGENITGTGLQMAFTRGAARQFQKPWIIDLSSWFGASVRDYTPFMSKLAKGIQKADFEGDRIAILDSAGNLLVKEGSVNNNWINLASAVTDFALEGTRIAMKKSNGDLWVKEPSTSSNWNLLAGNVSSFQLNGSRIGILKGSALAIKEPNTNSNYQNYIGMFRNFRISENRLAMLNTSNVLTAQNANLTSSIYTIAAGVSKYFITDNYLAYTTLINDSLYLTTGNFTINTAKTYIARDVADVKINGNRILYKKNDKSLWLSVSGGAPLQIASDVFDFELDANRIAQIKNTSNDLYLLTGNNYNYLNTEYTDQGWRFVSESIKQPFLVNSNSRLGLWSSHASSDLFVKTTSLDQNEPGTSKFWNESGVAGGHSDNFSKRVQYFSYMAGANVFHGEASNVNYFLGPYTTLNGSELVYSSLSPLGKVGQNFYDFTVNKFPERGIPYQSVAVMLPINHGLGLKTWDGTTNWVYSYLAPDNGDLMNKSLMESIWPGILNANNTTESKQLGNTPYGELFDVITQSCPLNVLKEYPVVILSGNVNPDATFTKKLRDYVSAGGNLIINVASKGTFSDNELGMWSIGTEFSMNINNVSGIDDNFSSVTTVGGNYTWRGLNPDLSRSVVLMKCNNNNDIGAVSTTLGNGKLITVAATFMRNTVLWQKLLQLIVTKPQVTPFAFSGSMQYAYSFIGDTDWNIMMINNKGVSKSASTSAFETIDESQISSCSFVYQEGNKSIISVKDITKGGASYPFSGQTINAMLEPGEIKILQIKVGPQSTSALMTNTDNHMIAVDQLDKKSFIKLYPNPINKSEDGGNINVRFYTENSEIGSIQIFNSIGQRVLNTKIVIEKGITDVPLEIRAMPPGIYYLQLNGATGKKLYPAQKFLKF